MSAPCKTFYSSEILESNGHIPFIESSKNGFSFIFTLVSRALAPCSCACCPGGKAAGSVSPVLPVQVGGTSQPHRRCLLQAPKSNAYQDAGF